MGVAGYCGVGGGCCSMMWTFLSSLSCHVEKSCLYIWPIQTQDSVNQQNSKLDLNSMNDISANSYQSLASLLFSTLWSWNCCRVKLPSTVWKRKVWTVQCDGSVCSHVWLSLTQSDSVHQAVQSLLEVSRHQFSFFFLFCLNLHFEFQLFIEFIFSWIPNLLTGECRALKPLSSDCSVSVVCFSALALCVCVCWRCVHVDVHPLLWLKLFCSCLL